MSPGFPDEYESNLLCVYNISSPDSFANIIFEYFDVEKGSFLLAFSFSVSIFVGILVFNYR